MYIDLKSKYRQVETGNYIVLTTEIKNNNVKLPITTEGKIIYSKNQIEADIWFYDTHSYLEDIPLEKNFYRDGSFEGIVLKVKADKFAIKFNHRDHGEILVMEDKLFNIPFFSTIEHMRKPSNTYKRNNKDEMERQYHYQVIDLIEYLDEAFQLWVEENTETLRVTEEEKENGDYPEEYDWVFDSESQNKFRTKQKELELEFAKATGLYNHFLGGTIES